MPVSTKLAQTWHKALGLAGGGHADDIGYPLIDPATDELVLSAVTYPTRLLLEREASGLGVPYRIREVKYSLAFWSVGCS